MFALAILAVAGCALCNGVAAILQKMGADAQRKATSLDAHLFVRLVQNMPYIAGLVLDLLGWVLTVFAVRYIPLFLAEAVIATNVAITALLERKVMKRRLPSGTWRWLLLLLGGLACLGASAQPQHAVTVHGVLEWSIVAMPAVCLALGAVLVHVKGRLASFGMAALSGVAFGGTSVVGRVLPISPEWWRLFTQPLLWSLVLYGIAGVWLFTIALQRSLATTVNASMTAAQTLIPSLIGLILLGDRVRGDSEILFTLGMVFALSGVAGLAAARRASASD